MIVVTGCRVLVQPLKLEELDETIARAKAIGLTMLDIDERKARTATEKGRVLQLGPKVNADYTEGAAVGDIIGFTKFGGKFVKDGEEDLLIINDEDVICIFKDKQ
jgi:co-chaperonin GroES (HSP10)